MNESSLPALKCGNRFYSGQIPDKKRCNFENHQVSLNRSCFYKNEAIYYIFFIIIYNIYNIIATYAGNNRTIPIQSHSDELDQIEIG